MKCQQFCCSDSETGNHHRRILQNPLNTPTSCLIRFVHAHQVTNLQPFSSALPTAPTAFSFFHKLLAILAAIVLKRGPPSALSNCSLSRGIMLPAPCRLHSPSHPQKNKAITTICPHQFLQIETKESPASCWLLTMKDMQAFHAPSAHPLRDQYAFGKSSRTIFMTCLQHAEPSCSRHGTRGTHRVLSSVTEQKTSRDLSP